MILDDLSRSIQVSATEYTQANFLFRLTVNVSDLMASVQ